MARKSDPALYALVAYEDAYVQPLIVSALQSLLPNGRIQFLTWPSHVSPEVRLVELVPPGQPAAKMLQITPYEDIDFAYAAAHPATTLVNSYVIRKALIRKHYLSATVDHWAAKHPQTVLARHVRRSEAFELDYAEFLDDALVDAFDLRASLERNEGSASSGAQGEKAGAQGGVQDGGLSKSEGASQEWWILKPGMSDRGQGIRLFRTMAQLQGIFDAWEAERPGSDDEDEEEDAHDDDDTAAVGAGSGAAVDRHEHITTSHLRHFVAQPYIHPPLLLPAGKHGGRKFHIRTYVVCVGSLKVYVFREMLALFAAKAYLAPWESSNLDAHLTNTCLQEDAKEGSVGRFWDLDLGDVPAADWAAATASADASSSSSSTPSGPSAATTKEAIFAQICQVTGELFEAAARGMMVHFQPLPFAFEVFGLDFLVDARGTAWLLEANAFPDFKQTGDGLRDVVAEFWAGVLRLAVGPFVGTGDDASSPVAGSGGGDEEVEATGMELVRDIDLGRR